MAMQQAQVAGGSRPAQLFTVRETGDLLRMSRSKVYEEFASGRLRPVKIGRSTRVRSDDLAAWIDARTNEGAR
ncbi:MAG: helix-turn-helix domain-containing protein [Thermomicrobiales bacterium]